MVLAIAIAAISGTTVYALFLRWVRRYQGVGYYTPLKVVVGNVLVMLTGLALNAALPAPLRLGDALLVVALPHVLCGGPILIWQAIDVALRRQAAAAAEARELARVARGPEVRADG